MEIMDIDVIIEASGVDWQESEKKSWEMRTVFRRRFNKHMERASQRYREVLTRATGRGSINVRFRLSSLVDMQRWYLHILSFPFSPFLIGSGEHQGSILPCSFLFVLPFFSYPDCLLAPPSTEFTFHSTRAMLLLRIIILEIGKFVFVFYGFNHRFIFSKFWKLQVLEQGVGRIGFFPPWLIDGYLLCLHMVFTLCMSVS